MSPRSPALFHPEIELRSIDFDTGLEGLSFAEDEHTRHIGIDLLEVSQKRVVVKRDLKVTGLVEYLAVEQPDWRPTRVIFINDPNYGDSQAGSNGRARPPLNALAIWLRARFAVPLSFFHYMSPAQNYRYTGNGWFFRYDDESKDGDNKVSDVPEALDGFYQLSHGLRAGPTHTWFSHSLRHRHESTYIIYGCANDAKKHIMLCAETQYLSTLLRPLAIDAFLMEDYVDSWTLQVGALRSRLIRYETNFKLSSFTPEERDEIVEDLHSMSQHLHIARGNFDDFQTKITYFFSVLEQFGSLSKSHFSTPPRSINTIRESLRLLRSRAESLGRWAVNYDERTGIRIALSFNLTTQGDSRTNLSIARLTTKIAVATQRDSSSMITLAAVTMFFLPGSFVSSLFSMVFFTPQPTTTGGTALSVGPQWWLFPCVTIPLTMLVFLVWVVWKRRRTQASLQDVVPPDVDIWKPSALEDVERPSNRTHQRLTSSIALSLLSRRSG